MTRGLLFLYYSWVSAWAAATGTSMTCGLLFLYFSWVSAWAAAVATCTCITRRLFFGIFVQRKILLLAVERKILLLAVDGQK
jgi:hypothetical protein